MKRLVHLLVVMCLSILLLNTFFTCSAHAAGVTIVTHGFNSGTSDWVPAMAGAMTNGGHFNSGTNVFWGKLRVTDSPFQCKLEVQGVYSPNDVDSGERFLLLDWSDVDNQIELWDAKTTQAVAELVASKLLSAEFMPAFGHPLVELPLHLVGHSRGGSLVSALARKLSESGVWVDQVTMLDPHPCSLIGDNDENPAVWANVVFADNYYQTAGPSSLLDPNGRFVNGTYDRLLTDLVGGYLIEHSDVHLWYHGTCDWTHTPSSSDGACVVDATLRANWYKSFGPNENHGENTGYKYSRMAGGTVSGGTRSSANTGLFQVGSRVPLDVWGHPSFAWENVFIANLSENLTIEQGGGIGVDVVYSEMSGSSKIQIGLDCNANPYDLMKYGNLTSQDVFGNNPASPAIENAKRETTLLLDTTSVQPGTYYVYAQISGAHTRYYYSKGKVTISSPTRIMRLEGALSFGNVEVGNSDTRTMTICNDGKSVLAISSINYPAGFSGNWGRGTIEAGGSRAIAVTFSPTEVRSYGGTIMVSSDKTSGSDTKSCTGTGSKGGNDQLVIISPVGNPHETGNSSVVFHGVAPLGSVKVEYVNALTGGSDNNWDTVEADGTWGGRRISVDEGSNEITITARNAQGAVTGTGSITILRKNNIRETSTVTATYATIYSGKTKTSGNEACVGYDDSGYGIQRTLVKFLLPPLPIGSEVTGAEFRGVTYESSMYSPPGDAFNVTAKMVNESWSAGVSWNSFILGGSIPFISNGENTQIVPGADSWVYWNVTEVCQYWYNNTPNYGLILMADSAVEGEGVKRDRSFIPSKFRLAITYSVETTPPTVSITQPTSGNSCATSLTAINLSGTASDSQNVISGVTWSNGMTGGSGACSGTENWSVSSLGLGDGVNSIIVTATDAAGNIATDTLEVECIPPTKILRLAGNLSFGNVLTGGSAGASMLICNDGNSPLTVTDIVYPVGFSGSWTGTVQATQAQLVPVTFIPALVQAYSGAVTVISDRTGGGNTISCSGTGIAATRIIRVEGDLSFGEVVTNTAKVRLMTIHNDGNSALIVSGINYPSGFSGSFSNAISAGDSCIVMVSFNPTSTQSCGGMLTINSDKTSGSNTLSCSGTGVPATRVIRLAGDLAFGSVGVGASAGRLLSIYNDGNSALAVTSIVCTIGFSVESPSFIISPGDRVDVTVVFSPAEARSYSGTLTFHTDKTSGSELLLCSGVGIVGPVLSVSPALRIVTKDAGTTTFSATNTGAGTLAYTASESVSWLSITGGSSGGNSGTITVAYDANSGTTARTGTITVTASGANGSPKNVTLIQGGKVDFTYAINGEKVTITGYTGSGGAVTIPSAIDGKSVTSIRSNAFRACSSLTSVAIPSSVTDIGELAFYGCSNLTSVMLASSVTNIEASVFCNCANLTEIAVDAGNAAYSSASGVLFNKSQTSLIQCPGGKPGSYVIPDSVTSFGVQAFAGCTRLTSVTIPNSVTGIAAFAFVGCTRLTSITTGDGITSIGDYAFYGCASLTSIELPDNVTSIGNWAFSYCNRLAILTSRGNAPSVGSNVFIGANNVTVYYLQWTSGWGTTFGGRPTVMVPRPSTLSVTPDSRSVSSAAATTSFTVSNTGAGTLAYTASESVSWLSITGGSSGGNSGTITVAYDANSGTTARTGTITVTASGANGSPKNVTLIQMGSTMLTACIEVLASPMKGGSVTGAGQYIVGTEVTITATASNDWCFVVWSDGITNNPRSVDVTAGGDIYSAVFSSLVPLPGVDCLLNGGFELPASTSNQRLLGYFSFIGWNGFQMNGAGVEIIYGTSAGLAPHEGLQHFVLNGGSSASAGSYLEQIIGTVSGKVYEVHFGIGHSGSEMTGLQLQVQVIGPNSDVFSSRMFYPSTSLGYTATGLFFTANASWAKIRFTDQSSSNPSSDMFLDAVSVEETGSIDASHVSFGQRCSFTYADCPYYAFIHDYSSGNQESVTPGFVSYNTDLSFYAQNPVTMTTHVAYIYNANDGRYTEAMAFLGQKL